MPLPPSGRRIPVASRIYLMRFRDVLVDDRFEEPVRPSSGPACGPKQRVATIEAIYETKWGVPEGGRVDLICDQAGLERDLRELAQEIARTRTNGRRLALVGVRTRGVPIAERLAELLRASGADIVLGAVDTTLYRDDLENAERWPVLRGTDISFDVQDTEIVLVDDVLHTGRSVRAALNIVCDLGRPACVRLAIVVDRGGRELPIQADFVARRCEAGPNERIVVRVRPIDPIDGIERVLSQSDS